MYGTVTFFFFFERAQYQFSIGKMAINFKFDSGIEYLNEEYCLDFRL